MFSRLLPLIPACALLAAEQAPAPTAPASPMAQAAEDATPLDPAVNATPEALADSLKKAFESRDLALWKKQVQAEGLTAAEVTEYDRAMVGVFFGKAALRDIAVDTLPDGFEHTRVADGKKHSFTLKPSQLLGVITLRLRTAKAETELTLPYGRVGDSFKLAAARSEPLPAQKIPDARHSVEFSHSGAAEDITVRIRYTASGVKLEKCVSGRLPVIAITAQHIDSVQLERGGDDGVTELRIRREIAPAGWAVDYTSEKLTAAGRLLYEREYDTPATAE